MRFLRYIPLSLGLFVWFYALFSPKGLPDFLKLLIIKRALQSEIMELKEQNKHLQEELRKIKTDPLYLEHLARSQLGMIRDGEILIILPSNLP
jgi:cell division protein FtsB